MSNKRKIRKENESQKITTMKLLEETKVRLEKLRENKGESYDDLLRKILYVLNILRDEPEKARRVLERINEIRKRNSEEEKEREENMKEEKKDDIKNNGSIK